MRPAMGGRAEGLDLFSLPDDGRCGGEESALIDPIRMESTIVEVRRGSPAQDLHELTPPDGFEPSTDCLEGTWSIGAVSRSKSHALVIMVGMTRYWARLCAQKL